MKYILHSYLLQQRGGGNDVKCYYYKVISKFDDELLYSLFINSGFCEYLWKNDKDNIFVGSLNDKDKDNLIAVKLYDVKIRTLVESIGDNNSKACYNYLTGDIYDRIILIMNSLNADLTREQTIEIYSEYIVEINQEEYESLITKI